MPQASDLLTVAQVAAAFQVNDSTVRRWRSKGDLHGIKVGGTIRFRRDAVEALLAPQNVSKDVA